VVSLDFPQQDDSRFNAQLFQRRFSDHDPDIIPRARETGMSLFYSTKWGRFAPEILAIHSLDQSDWMVRPKLVWNLEKNWRFAFGVDIFGGKPTGLFGQYNHQDRVYAELRYSF
jgi:hypothetical protein